MYMALHITNAVIEQEVRELAIKRGQTITDLIGSAVKELKIQNDEDNVKPTVEELLAFLHSFPQGPINYSMSEDEILGYGPNGYSE